MKLKWSDLWTWEGEVGRDTYVFWGCLLFFIKFQLDRVVSLVFFNRDWEPWYYLMPWEAGPLILPSGIPQSLSDAGALFPLTIITMSLPFIYVGMMLSIRRLRSCGMPVSLVTVFFLPFIHYLLFAMLALYPPRPESYAVAGSADPSAVSPPSFWDRIIPAHPVGSALMGGFLTTVVGTLLTLVSVGLFKDYGWTLFVGLPFCIGMVPVLIYGYHRRRGFWSCMLVAWLATIMMGFALVAVRIEGIVCLIFLIPLALIFSTVGGVIGYIIQSRVWAARNAQMGILALMLSMPLLMGAEHAWHPSPGLFAVKTDMVIEAPPEKVWRHVVVFSELAPPTEPWFVYGIAYPMKAEIQGQGVGAIRHCVFSTGPFVEPIEVWDEPRLLKFSVSQQPPPMKEFSPFGELEAPHLDNYLKSRGGQFLLTPLADGRTRLEGTTWYTHRIWPQGYWKLWSDAIIHNIHLRVLRHIKQETEADQTV